MGKEEYRRRLLVFFSEKLDVDKNGYISWADYELLALRTTFQQNFGNYDQEIHKKYLQHSRQMWESLCTDLGVDKDDNVHFFHLIDFMYSSTNKTKKFEELPDFLQNLCVEVFRMIDRKGDNLWDRDEYRFGSVIWCYITNLKDIDNAFDSMLNAEDKIGGGISLDRYKELVVEFFTSMDGETPSRNIFGPLDPKRADDVLAKASPLRL
ncbi:sarcoplasmic calcium-binding protein, beta chain-like [Centruroides sculpturatus]|uniref:sarcoplasmic calcium-binding protein, beta chain-like n=1 Tax=Centruroides sculpturatus TaxID=218467 RepID=UPI000C6CEB8E|nr:sarcoplasmic calcium-binding protein, beta chain-like [Centruroides sculpturatus]XP_023220807.1 sarcoplasmic calcium-binding protein, beta chain-like [Centruroides sculpturatus]XP_023220808.1 sarcoplasmic calcium-binding protein, beta chain-like [Centruroides sculpturatus]XP_023220809.1 sarcoplasmic calcium-binding protein, beta chain-like [Centruroides sculpturatus]XP_023220810.1 sarcoplasmic calcium-binding protein, beta chain-like [Centruroides sculpturatus]